MQLLVMSVIVFFMAILNGVLYQCYIENNNLLKKKTSRIILISICILLNVFYMFYGKIVVLQNLLFLLTFSLMAYLFKKYKIQNKIIGEYLVCYINFLIVASYAILLSIKMFKVSMTIWVFEMCLLYMLVTHCMLFIKFYKVLTRRNNRDMKVVISISSVIYFLVAFILNKNYIQIKIIFLIFVIIGVAIILIYKISEIIKLILCGILVIIFLFIAEEVCSKNIEKVEISKESQMIKINDNLDDLENYSNNQKFVFFNKEIFDNKENITIYIVKEEHGKKVLEKNDIITDYEAYDALGEMYLEEITTTTENINNNVSKKTKTIRETKKYRLYYYK